LLVDRIIQEILNFIRSLFSERKKEVEDETELVAESEYARIYRIFDTSNPRQVATWMAELLYGDPMLPKSETRKTSLLVVAWHLRPGEGLPDIHPPVRQREKIVRGMTIRVKVPTHRIAVLVVRYRYNLPQKDWGPDEPFLLGYWDRDLQSVMSYSEDRIAGLIVSELAKRLSVKRYDKIQWEAEIDRICAPYLRRRR
jgi:hypothetical protein